MGRRFHPAGLAELWVVWLLFGLTAVAVFETYWRIPPRDLWKVTSTGFVGGAGRAFVFISFSAALAAVAVVAIRLRQARGSSCRSCRTRLARPLHDSGLPRSPNREPPRSEVVEYLRGRR